MLYTSTQSSQINTFQYGFLCVDKLWQKILLCIKIGKQAWMYTLPLFKLQLFVLVFSVLCRLFKQVLENDLFTTGI